MLGLDRTDLGLEEGEASVFILGDAGHVRAGDSGLELDREGEDLLGRRERREGFGVVVRGTGRNRRTASGDDLLAEEVAVLLVIGLKGSCNLGRRLVQKAASESGVVRRDPKVLVGKGFIEEIKIGHRRHTPFIGWLSRPVCDGNPGCLISQTTLAGMVIRQAVG
jgi:hypothetical protein